MALKPDVVAAKVLATTIGKSTEKALGAPTAKALVDLILGHSIKPTMAKDDEKAAIKGAEGYLEYELKLVDACGKRVAALFGDASSGKLAPMIAKNAMAEKDFSALGGDSDALKAAKWICNASNSDKKNMGTVAPGLAKILEEAAKKTTITSFAHVKVLQKMLVPKPATAVRAIVLGGKITSSVTGERLLEIALETISKKKPGAEDLACFLLGAVLRTHGFSDGNGRTARALYALALIQGKKPFVGVTTKLEDTLSELA